MESSAAGRDAEVSPPPWLDDSKVNSAAQSQTTPIDTSHDYIPTRDAAPTHDPAPMREAALVTSAPEPQPVAEAIPAALNGGGATSYPSSEEDNQRPRNPRRRRQFGGRNERPAQTELVNVETDPTRQPIAEPVVERAMAMPQRERAPRRARREAPPAEPLVQVETQKVDR